MRRQRHRRRQPEKLPFSDLPFGTLRSPFPPVTVLGPAEEDRIHAASMQILERVGMEFLDDEALDLWEKAGASVDRETRRVRMDRGLILEAVSQAPDSFSLRARNPKHSITIGGTSRVSSRIERPTS